MKFLQQTVTLLSFVALAYAACIDFEGTYHITARKQIDGTITVGGNTVCKYSGSVNADHYFATCNQGYASYIYSDRTKIAFNDGTDYLFDVTIKKDFNAIEQYERLSSKQFC